jgi:V/A-type H+-transporting ATPase subunit I
LIENPSDEDNVPTLLKNPKWVELVKPVFNIIGILPGYKELDISLFFFIFFSMFFGILIGDAGYASILLLATAFFQKKLSKTVKNKKPFILLYVLSGCAVLWGFLTGTFFGQGLFPQYIKPLWPWIADNVNFQTACFLIGAIHLSIAHIWRAILKFPSWHFLADVGWLLLIWGMFFLAKELILSITMPSFVKIVFMVGAALVIFFTSPHKNPLKAIGPGLGGFALNIINTFTDVVSYIRLFAFGLAGVAVADAFNTKALNFGFNTISSGVIAVLILVIGHFFNIILGILAVAVHGLRLNVLEFSNHLGLEWSGFSYQPFKKILKQDT